MSPEITLGPELATAPFTVNTANEATDPSVGASAANTCIVVVSSSSCKIIDMVEDGMVREYCFICLNYFD
jgi:hypothetical protein